MPSLTPIVTIWGGRLFTPTFLASITQIFTIWVTESILALPLNSALISATTYSFLSRMEITPGPFHWNLPLLSQSLWLPRLLFLWNHRVRRKVYTPLKYVNNRPHWFQLNHILRHWINHLPSRLMKQTYFIVGLLLDLLL